MLRKPWLREGTPLWLWCRLTAAASIRPLAWELPYATGAALKKKKRKEKKERRNSRSSRYGTTWSVASWECWDLGSIPSLAQWVRDPVLLQLQLRLWLQLRFDPWPQWSLCCGVAKMKKKKKKRERETERRNSIGWRRMTLFLHFLLLNSYPLSASAWSKSFSFVSERSSECLCPPLPG